MLNVVETGSGLVVSYPLWLGIVSVLGIALLAYAVRSSAVVKRRWGLLIVATMLVWTGIYFVTYQVTLTAESARIYGFLVYDGRIAWNDAESAMVVQKRGKGSPTHFIVVASKTGAEFEIPLGGLGDGERQRVVAYVYARMPK